MKTRKETPKELVTIWYYTNGQPSRKETETRAVYKDRLGREYINWLGGKKYLLQSGDTKMARIDSQSIPLKSPQELKGEIDQLTDELQDKAGALLEDLNTGLLGNTVSPFLYVLDGHTPVLARNVFHWAEFMENANRVITQTPLNDAVGSIVSTVFLGVDQGSMLLFETMRFHADGVELRERYQTWEAAEVGHQRNVDELLAPA